MDCKVCKHSSDKITAESNSESVSVTLLLGIGTGICRQGRVVAKDQHTHSIAHILGVY